MSGGTFPADLTAGLTAHSPRYGELLREIRQGNVRRVAFFENDEIMDDREQFQPVEGPCLVVFKDRRVAHSFVPRYDYRIPCAPLSNWAHHWGLLLGTLGD